MINICEPNNRAPCDVKLFMFSKYISIFLSSCTPVLWIYLVDWKVFSTSRLRWDWCFFVNIVCVCFYLLCWLWIIIFFMLYITFFFVYMLHWQVITWQRNVTVVGRQWDRRGLNAKFQIFNNFINHQSRISLDHFQPLQPSRSSLSTFSHILLFSTLIFEFTLISLCF